MVKNISIKLINLLQAYDKDSTGINKQITYNLTEGKPYFTVHSDGSLSATHGLKMESTQDGKFDITIGAYNMDPCSGSGQSTYLQNVTVVLQVCIERKIMCNIFPGPLLHFGSLLCFSIIINIVIFLQNKI